jgi:hypothetical protein
MPKQKSRVLKVSTRRPYVHKYPRVTAVLNDAIATGRWSQASLAAHSGVDRAVLNQLCLSKGAATDDLIGLLINAFSNTVVAELLQAFTDDHMAHVETVRRRASKDRIQPIIFSVHYPPQDVA